MRENFADLPDLIRFRLGAFALQVDPFDHTGLRKDVMPTGNPHAETLCLEKVAEFIEAQTGI
jgi:hypothetical protein